MTTHFPIAVSLAQGALDSLQARLLDVQAQRLAAQQRAIAARQEDSRLAREETHLSETMGALLAAGNAPLDQAAGDDRSTA